MNHLAAIIWEFCNAGNVIPTVQFQFEVCGLVSVHASCMAAA